MESKLKCVFDVDSEMLQVCYVLCVYYMLQHPMSTCFLKSVEFHNVFVIVAAARQAVASARLMSCVCC